MDTSGVLQDLKALARGEGVHAFNLAERLGSDLRAALGIAPDEAAPAVRRRVADVLGAAVARLPETVQSSVAAGLGLRPDAEMWFLGQRLSVVADADGYSVKTIRRRYLEGMELLADVLLAPQAPPAEAVVDDFWCADVSLELMLVPPGIELIETRTIVAQAAGLAAVPLAWSSDPDRDADAGPVRVDCLHGGLVVRDPDSHAPGQWRGRLQLPRALNPGDRHEFRTRVVDPCHRETFLLITPQRRIDRLLIRVKFPARPDGGRPVVERLDGIAARFVNDASLTAPVVDVDAVLEVTERFPSLRSGFSYGVRWRYPD